MKKKNTFEKIYVIVLGIFFVLTFIMSIMGCFGKEILFHLEKYKYVMLISFSAFRKQVQ